MPPDALSDLELAARARSARRAAETARAWRESADSPLPPLWEVYYLSPCDWHTVCATGVQAEDAERALERVLRAYPILTRREIVDVREVALPPWQRRRHD